MLNGVDIYNTQWTQIRIYEKKERIFLYFWILRTYIVDTWHNLDTITDSIVILICCVIMQSVYGLNFIVEFWNHTHYRV